MSEQGMNEVFDSLEELATGEREKQLTGVYITSERLRRWLLTTKEGKVISSLVIKKRESAIDAFTRCDINDVEAMKEARMEVEVSKRVFEMFQTIFQEGELAEEQLKQTGLDSYE